MLKSIWAIFAGMVVGAGLAMLTDVFLSLFGIISFSRIVSGWSLLLALVYRAIYTVLSGYIAARLAPDRPLGHAITLGAIGVIVTVLGSIAAWSKSAGYEWYPIALIVITLPCCYLGGKLRVR
jgi:hypothetical protein